METMVELNTLLPLLKPFVPGASDAILLQALSEVARRFCTATRIWREELDPITVRDGRTEYPLELDEDDVEIVGVVSVTQDGSVLTASDDYTVDETNSLILDAEPTEDSTGGLVVLVTVRPARYGTRVVDHVANDWGEYLVAGAQAYLCAQPKKPWTNLQAAQIEAQGYAAGVANAQADAMRGRKLYRSLTITPRRIA